MRFSVPPYFAGDLTEGEQFFRARQESPALARTRSVR